MTTELESNLYTHKFGTAVTAHSWRYEGRKKQSYICMVCQLKVTKGELKEATDA